jgi:hypothetical protein
MQERDNLQDMGNTEMDVKRYCMGGMEWIHLAHDKVQ